MTRSSLSTRCCSWPALTAGLAAVQVDTLDEAIALVNSNEHGNGTALFTRSGVAARKFQSDIQVGMVGINVRGLDMNAVPCTSLLAAPCSHP